MCEIVGLEFINSCNISPCTLSLEFIIFNLYFNTDEMQKPLRILRQSNFK